jgi:DNA repair protein RecN (Recombination protein N)
LLLSINIHNYTLVESLEIEFNQGTTAITGETGAGKSLVLDALGMALGDRADTDTIRHGKDRAEITATFDLTGIENATNWLLKNDFETGATCLLRRIYTREGRSKGYINGQPSTMSQLQELGEMLTDIHSQHEHQSLLRKDTHRRLLDEYAGVQSLSTQVTAQFNLWQQAHLQLDALVARLDEVDAKKDLLSFQVNELQQIDVSVAHIEQLERDQSTLANAEQILQDSHNLLAICEQAEDLNLRDNMNRALSILANMSHKPEHLLASEELLKSSLIQLEEAVGEIKHHVDKFEADPHKLQMVEEELAAVFQFARKHRVSIDQLEAKNIALIDELNTLVSGNENITFLQQSLDELASNYEVLANKLSKKRSAAAIKMASEINQQIHMLAMEGAQLMIQLTPIQQGQYHANGLEKVEFLLTTNAGQPHKPLSKIASGGELSRVSLAIQVVAGGHSKISTLVFDEVDVGIGGSTADVVGRLLKALGERGQVISVTHQPQVAAHAHHHYLARKITKKGQTASVMVSLDPSQRVNELARMLGGATVTKQTLSHAAELLSLASS